MSAGDAQGIMSLVAGQASAEPGEAIRDTVCGLLGQVVPGVTLFRGLSLCDPRLLPDDPRLRVKSTGLLGTNQAMWARGQLTVIPEPVSRVPQMLRSGTIRNDLLLLRAKRVGGGFTTGVVNDYVPAAVESAAEIVVQLTDDLPVLPGAPVIPGDHVSRAVAYDDDRIPTYVGGDPTPQDLAVAENVAQLVSDGDCIQIGFGRLSRAIAMALARTRRNLGTHTGLIDDAILQLIDSGAVTNTRKTVDRGYSVTPIAMGSADFYRRIAKRKDILLRPVDHTNNPRIIGELTAFTSINSGISVDLLGQVNAELRGNRRHSTGGGQHDFVSGARLSRGGKSIVALRSTAGSVSRIVPFLPGGVVTLPAGCVDFVVTEYGIAELRGASLEERAMRLVRVAHPTFRPSLLEAFERDERIHHHAPNSATRELEA